MKRLKISFGIMLLMLFVSVSFLSANTVGTYQSIDKHFQSLGTQSAPMVATDTIWNTIKLLLLGFVIGLFIYSTRLIQPVAGAASVASRKAIGTSIGKSEYINSNDESPPEPGPASESEDDGK